MEKKTVKCRTKRCFFNIKLFKRNLLKWKYTRINFSESCNWNTHLETETELDVNCSSCAGNCRCRCEYSCGDLREAARRCSQVRPISPSLKSSRSSAGFLQQSAYYLKHTEEKEVWFRFCCTPTDDSITVTMPVEVCSQTAHRHCVIVIVADLPSKSVFYWWLLDFKHSRLFIFKWQQPILSDVNESYCRQILSAVAC